ncbi:phosphoenolpyruvate synthase [Leptolinea sp. HRD-7]|nr:phosphoenolpyruvate synthase [Leptolinea sp. HRD-7]
MKYVKDLNELNRADLPLAGGKGANLGALIKAGLPVPGGFVICTGGYRDFVNHNGLDSHINRILETIQPDDPDMLEQASAQIRAAFQAGSMPADLRDEIRAAYSKLEKNCAVAVRSSATAEDLPDMSFAGQQDTYLNIVGEDALLMGTVNCWASLWTARAIGYRARNAIAHSDAALAVVVQHMVQSEASGVLFTANPLTGKRAETVIDATLGLGEALVSGQVVPDHYVVDRENGVIVQKTLGEKALAITGVEGGGTVTKEVDAASRQALPDERILELAELGRQAEESFGGPQDMEWALADGRLYVVQSRPVTSLYPLPPAAPDGRLEMLLSFGVWQGMLDPYTPLGQDVFRYLVVGFARKFGGDADPREQRVMLTAGDRLFVNLTGLLGNPVGRNVADIFLASIDPETHRIISNLLEDSRFSRQSAFPLKDRLNLMRVAVPLAGNAVRNMLAPARGRKRLEKRIDTMLEEIRSRCAAASDLPALLRVFEETTAIMPTRMLPTLVGGIASGQAPYQILLRKLDIPDARNLLVELTRGMAHNVTTQMDLELWEAAQAIRSDSAAAGHFSSTPVGTLVDEYRRGGLPSAAQNAIEKFLSVYGIRGVGEIDMGMPRWREHPSNLFQALKSYLDLDPEAGPDVIFRRGVAKADEAEKCILAALREKPFGFMKAGIVKSMIHAFRELGGLRETPKFFVVRILSTYRYALLAEGEKLVTAGVLSAADDVMFLHLWELKELAAGTRRDWKALVAERRVVYARELRRRRIPRVLLTDGTAYYDAPARAGDGKNALIGSPVSAGVVEGNVRVVLDPHGAQLQPGEIMVCPASDPAWTPLFLAAGGLVTEVGGMMTHGSVVAREYGIPAVVGVSSATTRLKTGQRVRVDGSTGIVRVME